MAADSISLIIPRRPRLPHELLANEASESEMDELTRKFAVLESWSQLKTLAPPPYPRDCESYTIWKGHDQGDPEVDSWPERELLHQSHAGFNMPAPLLEPAPPLLVRHGLLRGQRPEPLWVDWAKIERAQATFAKYYSAFYLGLLGILMQGFVIGRFSDILVLAGYSRSPTATYERFKSTGMHIRKWVMEKNLKDPASEGRRSILQVRLLHALARKRAADTFEQAQAAGHNVGVPLSQFDLAQVLMAFGPIVINALTYEMRAPITNSEYDDYTHLWRFIGYHLGMDDRFNPCSSAERSLQLRDEFFATVPHYTRSCRPSTIIMVRSCLYGFGRHLGMGHRVLSALVIAGAQRKWLNTSYLGLDHFYPRSAVAPLRWFLNNMVHKTRLRVHMNRAANNRIAREQTHSTQLYVMSYYVMPIVASCNNMLWIVLDRLATNKWLFWITMIYLARRVIVARR